LRHGAVFDANAATVRELSQAFAQIPPHPRRVPHGCRRIAGCVRDDFPERPAIALDDRVGPAEERLQMKPAR
jgi:hypothetical protein